MARRGEFYTLDETVWLNHIQAAVELTNSEIAVGVVGENDSDLAKIAFWNHYGTRKHGKRHTPPRPFFDITMERVASELEDVEDLAIGKILQGMPVKQALGLVGAWLAGEVQQTIADLKIPGNAPSTIAQKGFDNPLIGGGTINDNGKRKRRVGGRLRQSITYQVRPYGKSK